ncbi:hypothetical protein [Nitrosophilus alvini]|uniref:hypothetical protein n=1 Tax=Nitrosophilus alvini TaxID=2714855 RepID=UPI00190D9F88|nr:hypothetical protein [Nitrosophilus alvini]
MKNLPVYLLIFFLVGSMAFVILSPFFIVEKIKEDSKKPKSEREFVYRGDTKSGK